MVIELRDLRRFKEKLLGRIAGVVTRAGVTAIEYGGRLSSASVSLLAGETRQAVEVFQPYGVDAAVPVGAEGIALAVGGGRDHLALVCASPEGRPTSKESGEVDYWCVHGQRIRHHKSGSTSIEPGPAGFVFVGCNEGEGKPIALDGDRVILTGPWKAYLQQTQAAWAAPGVAALLTAASVPPPTPPGFVVGSVQASATKARAK